MTDQVAIALIGFLLTALTAFVVPLLVRMNARIRHLEQQNRSFWLYTRRLLDHIYRHSDTSAHPIPEPPEGLLDSE